MSQDNAFRAPAGWYPDPLGLPQLRWWNNNGWTEQVSVAPEPVVVQEARFAWMEDEAPLRAQAATVSTPPQAPAPLGSTLNQLEAPRGINQVHEPASYVAPAQAVAQAPVQAAAQAPVQAPVQAAAQAAVAAPIPAAAPAPSLPAYWDEDDMSLPVPSVNPADLKFWSGTRPAEVRRQAREQAERDAAQ